MPPRYMSSVDINAMIASTAPAVLDLLADGTPRGRGAIIEALAGRYAKDDVVCTLMRLAVIGQLIKVGRKFTVGAGRLGTSVCRQCSR